MQLPLEQEIQEIHRTIGTIRASESYPYKYHMFVYADPWVSPLWLPKHDLKKNDTNRRANMDRGMLTRPQLETKNQGQLRNAESEKLVFFSGKKKGIFQYHLVEEVHCVGLFMMSPH